MATELIRKEKGELDESREREVSLSPRTDIFENEDEYLLITDIPGARTEDLTIQVDAEHLTLEAHMDSARPGVEIAREFRPAHYRRSFTIPAEIDRDKVSADCKNGVLWLHLPKRESVKPRRIPVRASA